MQGFEYDWLAVDADGCIAFFSTAGGGYAPAPLLEDASAYDAAIECILELRARTSARCELELPPALTNSWCLVAERGLFAFDSDCDGGPYTLIATPGAPAHIEDLPRAVADVARRITYRGIQFRLATALAKAQLSGFERRDAVDVGGAAQPLDRRSVASDLLPFTKSSFVEADPASRVARCRALSRLLSQRMPPVSSLHDGALLLVAELRALGHDLWSFDADSGEWEIWCSNYKVPTGPGIIVTFRVDRVCVEWSEH
ncbi:MAG: hypothetical protein ACHREM_08170 [Polyangiales bacterium]